MDLLDIDLNIELILGLNLEPIHGITNLIE